MRSAQILVIDNVDSFTFMLVDYLKVLGAKVLVRRNDELDVDQALALGLGGLLISPGPGAPEDAGISVLLAKAAIERRRPLLGVCLGHQAIALACGGRVGRCDPVHGKVASVRHDGTGLFTNIPSPFQATRYHSLAAQDLPSSLLANAWAEDGTIMALRHRSAPAHGLQFHPESIASEHGRQLLASFVESCTATA